MQEPLESRTLLSVTPSLLGDLNPSGDSSPSEFVQVGDATYFVADDGTSGRELWRTDGSPGNTSLVKDILPGSGSSNPEELVALGNELFFVADDGTSGSELWKTDGTAAGTVLVSDIYPGSSSLASAPHDLTVVGGILFFSAEDDASGIELWKSNGTTTGTTRVADIASGAASSNPQKLVDAGGTLFFTADDGTSGRELWKSNGSAAGTARVRDIHEGTQPGSSSLFNSSNPEKLTDVGGTLFFVATTGQGRKLWTSTGTEAGTVLVDDLRPGADDFTNDDSLFDLNGTLLFTADNGLTGRELWTSDGTAAGTQLLKDLYPGSEPFQYYDNGNLVTGTTANASAPEDLARVNNTVFFSATTSQNGRELWKTDGTAAGTVLVEDLFAGTTYDANSNTDVVNSSSPEELTTAGTTLYFTADDGTSGRELWSTDGTAAGTARVADLLAGSGSSSPLALFGRADTLFFSADDGTSGRELWAIGAEVGSQPREARLTILIDGQKQAIPANVGVDSGGGFLSQIHTTDIFGSLRMEPIASEPLGDVTLGDFFDTWRTNAGVPGNNASAIFNENQILGNTTDGNYSIQMFVNGQAHHRFDDYVIANGDDIVLAYTRYDVVSLNTNVGSILMELLVDDAPGTVQNFLNYVNDGDYANTFFHRAAETGTREFVIQTGGFTTSSLTFQGLGQFSNVPVDPTIQNEFSVSNTRGTVAMAKLGGNPDSATSQFFVNLDDNSANLDSQNGGFTVFARVLDMAVADQIAAFGTSDLDNQSSTLYDEVPLTSNNQLVVIESIGGEGFLSGTSFNDSDSDDVHDASETGLAGATVFIDANANGLLDPGEASTTTNSAGNWTLRAAAGTHIVRQQTASASDPPTPTSRTATAQIVRETGGLDFANTGDSSTDPPVDPPDGDGSISGFVYSDANGNDSREDGELGAGGVMVTLTGTDTQGASVSRSVLTSREGSYRFADVAAGTYQVAQRQPAVLGDGQESIGTLGGTTDNDRLFGIVLGDNEHSSDNNFGETGLLSPYINLGLFLASTNSLTDYLIQTIAGAEQSAGNTELATLIREGATEVPAELADELNADGETGGSDGGGDNGGDNGGDDPTDPVPSVADDSYTVVEDGGLAVSVGEGVLGNDDDLTGTGYQAERVSDVTHGELTFLPDGSFLYFPDADFFGTDTFTYRLADGTQVSAAATVTIVVTSSDNDPPVGTDDTYHVDEDNGLQVDAANGVLANDLDPDGDSLSVVMAGYPQNGSVALDPPTGSFAYTPKLNFSGTDTFTYTVSDGTFNSGLVTVTIIVDPVDDPPVAEDDEYLILPDTPTTIDVLANDTDIEGDTLATSLVQPPANGTLTPNSDGTLIYSPNSGFHGLDSFKYRALSGSVGSVYEATVRLVVNNGPQVQHETYTLDEDTSLTRDAASGLLASATDADGDSLEVSLVTSTQHGSLSLAADGSFAYTPDGNYSGSDHFTYLASDSFSQSGVATVTFTITPANDAPVAGDDAYTVAEDATIAVVVAEGLLSNDSDPDADSLTATLVASSGPSNGVLTFGGDGSFTYSPNANFVGTDSFTYTAGDGSLESAAATVTITVTAVNDAPVANGDSGYNVVQGSTLTVDAAAGLLGNDTDVDGSPAIALSSLVITEINYHPADPTTAELTEDPTLDAEDFEFIELQNVGEDTIDLSGVAFTEGVAFTFAGGTQLAAGQTVLVARNAAALGVRYGSTLDIAGEFSSSDLSNTGEKLALADAVDRVIQEFTYGATGSWPTEADGQGGTLVAVDVTGDYDDPANWIAGGLSGGTPGDGTTVTAAVDRLIAELVVEPTNGQITLHPDGSFEYTPDAGFAGTDTFTYRATDGANDSQNAEVEIVVTAP